MQLEQAAAGVDVVDLGIAPRLALMLECLKCRVQEAAFSRLASDLLGRLGTRLRHARRLCTNFECAVYR